MSKKNDENFQEDVDAEEDDNKRPPQQQVPSSNLNEELASHKPATSHKHEHHKQHEHHHHHHRHEHQVEEAFAMEEGVPFEEKENIKEANPQDLVAEEGISIEYPDMSGGQCTVSTVRSPAKQEQKSHQNRSSLSITTTEGSNRNAPGRKGLQEGRGDVGSLPVKQTDHSPDHGRQPDSPVSDVAPLPLKQTDRSPEQARQPDFPESGVASLPLKLSSCSQDHGRRSDSPESNVASLPLEQTCRSQDHGRRSDSPESRVASLSLEQTGRSQDHEQWQPDSSRRTHAPNYGTSQVGAIAVPGINAETESDEISFLDMEEMGTVPTPPCTVVAEPFTGEVLTDELREELRREGREELERSAVQGVVVAEKPEFWTKKRLLFAALALMAIAGVVVGCYTAFRGSAPSSWSQVGETLTAVVGGTLVTGSLALSADGTTAAFSVISNEGGYVRVYGLNASTLKWEQMGSAHKGESAMFGYSVALSSDGTVLAVGVPPFRNDTDAPGQARVYEWDTNDWQQVGSDLIGMGGGDFFGVSVALSADGTIVASGASLSNESGSSAGSVQVFQRSESEWQPLGSPVLGNATVYAGWSVALSSDGLTLAVGAPGGPGTVQVFDFDGDKWSQVGQDLNGEAVLGWFGYSVSLSEDGSIVACGEPLNSDNGNYSGIVHVFHWSGTTWEPMGGTLSGASEDYFGAAMAMSQDGFTLVVGAPAGTLASGGLENVGNVSVLVFSFDGSDWQQQSIPIESSNMGAYIGIQVAVSANGHAVAAGDIWLDKNSSLSEAHMRVFEQV